MEHISLFGLSFSLVEWILFGLILFFFLVQILFYLLVYNRPYSYTKKHQTPTVSETDLPPISVIISTKNNSKELAENLPFILEQEYPNFQVVVINSGSTDETDTVLKSAATKYPHLYHTYVPDEADSINEKKLALTIGIKAAKHDFLLFTEAYCRPTSPFWMLEYGKSFAQEKEIVLGFSRLRIGKKAKMRRFIRFDNMVHHLKFLSMALLGKPYMGIGRNMGYRKDLFFRNKGFSSILNNDAGEDDLFINRVARKAPTGVLLSPESMIETHGIESFSSWRALKSPYLYTKQYYRGLAPRLLNFEIFSRYTFYLLCVPAIWLGIVYSSWLVLTCAVLLLIIRFLIQLRVINQNSKLLDEGTYHINLLLYDLIQPINNSRFRRYAVRRTRHRR